MREKFYRYHNSQFYANYFKLFSYRLVNHPPNNTSTYSFMSYIINNIFIDTLYLFSILMIYHNQTIYQYHIIGANYHIFAQKITHKDLIWFKNLYGFCQFFLYDFWAQNVLIPLSCILPTRTKRIFTPSANF